MTGRTRNITESATTRICVKLLACALTLSLAGCFDSNTKKADTSTGGTATPPPSSGGTVTPPPATGPTNKAPTISGTPVTSAKTTLPYSFQPVAADADGDKLTFSIAGKPDWATFNPSNGALAGTRPTALPAPTPTSRSR